MTLDPLTPDIDECSPDVDCVDICTNTIGSYFCSCREGFSLTEDGFNCIGIREHTAQGVPGTSTWVPLCKAIDNCSSPVDGDFYLGLQILTSVQIPPQTGVTRSVLTLLGPTLAAVGQDSSLMWMAPLVTVHKIHTVTHVATCTCCHVWLCCTCTCCHMWLCCTCTCCHMWLCCTCSYMHMLSRVAVLHMYMLSHVAVLHMYAHVATCTCCHVWLCCTCTHVWLCYMFFACRCG